MQRESRSRESLSVIATYRELMLVIAYQSAVDVEWLDEQYLDTSAVPVAERVNNRRWIVS